jgi:hypothetical protein
MAATDTGYYDSSSDWAIQARKLSEEKYELDLQSKLVYAERQGRQEGRQEVVELLKSGKSPEEIIKEYDGN